MPQNDSDVFTSLGLSDEATKRISLIDVIWLRQNGPVCAFEVEETTSVYSGLLRMSDLISVIPALNIKLFIVAPRERQGRFMAELNRPTFQKIGLSEFCRFIASEDLEKLVGKVDKTCRDWLLSIRDLLYWFDFYCGHAWAIQLVQFRPL